MAISLSLLFIIVLLALAVPFWIALGMGTVVLLLSTEALPLSLLGEALFELGVVGLGLFSHYDCLASSSITS